MCKVLMQQLLVEHFVDHGYASDGEGSRLRAREMCHE